jgi:hypothetical protein
MDRFISFTAMEVIACDWDGYPMNRNNYRLYHDPQRVKSSSSPPEWIRCSATRTARSGPTSRDGGAALMETMEGRDRYYARLAEIMKTVFRTDVLVKRLDELEADSSRC